METVSALLALPPPPPHTQRPVTRSFDVYTNDEQLSVVRNFLENKIISP